jgi:hypothetical protein
MISFSHISIAAISWLFLLSVTGAPVPPKPFSEAELDLLRWRLGYVQRADPVFGIPPGAYQAALKQIERSKRFTRFGLATEAETVWTSIGPAPLMGGQINDPVPPDVTVSGRIVGIVADPLNTNHWFIAASGGGVWETSNAGVTWVPKTDDQPSLQMNVLAGPPGNSSVLYAGTGNYGAYASAGIEILRSTNGGSTWTAFAPTAFNTVDYFSFTGMTVSPSNTHILLCAASDFFGPTISSGIFRSTNGGVDWNRVLSGVGTALAANPKDFNAQYAALRTIYGPSDGSSNGVYRTFDSGLTWQRLAGPWGTITNNGNPILLALPQADTNVAFVCISGESLWRSANAWAVTPTWNQLPLPPAEPNISLMGADSESSSALYGGGVNLWRLTGTTWTNITGGTHVDQHSMAWAGNTFILGNDGGLWTSLNSGSTWSNHNAGLGTVQFYRGSLHPTNANFALGGSQDNGEEKWLGGSSWQFIFGGDDFSSAIANLQPDSNWAICYYYLNILRTRDGGQSFEAADGGIDGANRPFYSYFVKSPTRDDIFITATDNLWKTTNFFSGATVNWFTNGPEMGSPITTMAFAPSDSSANIYAFAANNSFFASSAILRRTTNGGTTWSDLDPSARVPNRTVTGMAFAASNASVMYVTLSGFNSSSGPGHVFKTINALSPNPIWTDISPPIDIPHNAIVADGANGERVFAATDIGIWTSANAGTNWVHMGPEVGMPNVLVQDLQLNPANGRLVAFTYGRGAFALVNSTNVAALSFTSIKRSGADVLLTFKTVIGRNYLLRRSSTLNPPAWFPIASNVPGTGNLVTIIDSGGGADAKRFYQAVALP